MGEGEGEEERKGKECEGNVKGKEEEWNGMEWKEKKRKERRKEMKRKWERQGKIPKEVGAGCDQPQDDFVNVEIFAKDGANIAF